jgi:hypothetical protein
VLAIGSSMGGLVSALEDQDSQGRIDGALTTCGIVAGGINLNEFQLDGEYAMAQLLLPGQQVQLTGFGGPAGAGQAFGTAATLTGAAAQAQQTPAGRAPLALALAFLNAIHVGPGRGGPGPGQRPSRAGGRPVRRRVLRAVQHPRLHRAGPRVDRSGGRRQRQLERRHQLRVRPGDIAVP